MDLLRRLSNSRIKNPALLTLKISDLAMSLIALSVEASKLLTNRTTAG